MRVLIACDSFKDALAADQVCAAIASGLRGRAEVTVMPLADGGEGTFAVLAKPLGLRTLTLQVSDPLMRPVQARYGLSSDGALALIEMAEAGGLQRLTLAERDPLRTTSYGVGQMLADAQARGAARVVLAIGGSATNDGGAGAAAALGWRFLNAAGDAVAPCGGALRDIAVLAPPNAPYGPRLEVICDVANPLLGPQGASLTYGAQKGGDAAALARLEAGLAHLAGLVDTQLGQSGLADVPGAGAAGGLGFGAMAFLGGRLRRGVDVVLDLAGFDAALAEADLVVTGEGRLDGQTLHGKLIEGVCARARAAGTPVMALCGAVMATPQQLSALGLKAAYEISDPAIPLPERLAGAAHNLAAAARALPL